MNKTVKSMGIIIAGTVLFWFTGSVPFHTESIDNCEKVICGETNMNEK